MRLSAIRRGLTLASSLLIIGSMLIVIGTFYTIDHLSVQSVTSRRTVSPQGLTFTLTFNIHNAGLYDVSINLLGRILSAQQDIVQNSTRWTVTPGTVSNHTFTLQIDNATAATYFTPLAPQPIFDFTVVGTTAYGLLSVTLTGQRNINITGG